MKTFVPLKKILFALALSTTGLLLFAQGASADKSIGNLSTSRDTILISKSQTSKKHKIKLYPNPGNDVLFFSVNGQSGKVYQLYLFNMDGRLAKQTQIRNKETTVLANISKGNYTFEVFSDDERIENGQLIVK